MKSDPSVCILTSGVRWAVSPKSKAYLPRVNDGQAAGSTAMIRTSRLLRSFSPRKGKAMPAKFEPPPVQPTTMSG